MNRREFNVLQTMFMKKKFWENFKNELKSSKVITNDEYYRIENIDKLQQILKKKKHQATHLLTRKKLTKKFD